MAMLRPADEMKDSGIEWIGEIPSKWELHRIRNNFRIITGNGFKPELQGHSSGEYPVCKASDISLAGSTLSSAANYIDGAIVREEHFNIIPANSIIFPKIGEAMKKNNRSRVLVDCCVDNNCQGVVPQLIHSVYSYYLLSCIDMSWFDNAGTIPSLNNQKLRDCKIPYPSITEQQAIADYLDDRCSKIDEIIAEATASIEEYKELKQAVIDKYTMFGINKDVNMRDTGYSWFPHMPSHWKLVRANRLYKEDVRPVQDGDVSLSLSQVDGLIPTDDMSERSLKSATHDNWKHVIPEDLVLNRFKGHLGVFFASKYEGMVSFHYGVYHAIRDGVLSKYYEYLFHSTTYKSIFALLSNGITVGLQNLSNGNFYSVKLLLPPIEEQVDIVRHLDERTSQIDALISEKQALIEDLQAYKKSLIYEVVTGKRRVV